MSMEVWMHGSGDALTGIVPAVSLLTLDVHIRFLHGQVKHNVIYQHCTELNIYK